MADEREIDAVRQACLTGITGLMTHSAQRPHFSITCNTVWFR